MTETTNLGLPIYGANDVPLWTNTNDGFEALDSLVNSCAVVELDWGHPLHTFSAGNLSYTVTEDDCYLCGQMYGYTTDNHIYINDTIIAVAFALANNFYLQNTIPPTKLSKGDVVRVDSAMNILRVFKGKLVSGNTYVFNEAQVTLDYANPLHTFTSGDSYTATEDCWLVGTGNNLVVTIDGRRVVDSTSANYINMPPMKLAKGQTVATSGSPQSIHLFALRGTVTGSVGNLGGHPTLNYANPLHTFSGTDNLTWTATKDCYLVGTIIKAEGGEVFVRIDNAVVAYSSALQWSSHNVDSTVWNGGDISYIHVAQGQTVTVSRDCPLLGAYEVL